MEAFGPLELASDDGWFQLIRGWLQADCARLSQPILPVALILWAMQHFRPEECAFIGWNEAGFNATWGVAYQELVRMTSRFTTPTRVTPPEVCPTATDLERLGPTKCAIPACEGLAFLHTHCEGCGRYLCLSHYFLKCPQHRERDPQDYQRKVDEEAHRREKSLLGECPPVRPGWVQLEETAWRLGALAHSVESQIFMGRDQQELKRNVAPLSQWGRSAVGDRFTDAPSVRRSFGYSGCGTDCRGGFPAFGACNPELCPSRSPGVHSGGSREHLRRRPGTSPGVSVGIGG